MPAEDVTPRRALETPGIREALCYAFDFELLPEPQAPEKFAVDAGQARVVAVNATGGAYVECRRGGDTVFIFVDPRGMAGPVATSFAELLRLVIQLPYFREVLLASTGRDLESMRRAARRLEDDVREDLPFFEAARQDLVESLSFSPAEDPVAELHAVVTRQDLVFPVIAADGSPCTPLL